jgi:predicted amidohydrolase
VEFPELSRLMADQGMNILFVPFLTDTQNGYTRVKHCAQARAIENECYVAIAGCVGNLPKSTIWIFSMHKRVLPLIPKQWNQSRSNSNTEMTLIVDVDINLLKHCTNTAASTP